MLKFFFGLGAGLVVGYLPGLAILAPDVAWFFLFHLGLRDFQEY